MKWLCSDRRYPEAPDDFEIWRPQPHEIALLQYTSGSTSAARGVALSHFNIVENIAMQAKILGCGPGSVMVTWLPPYHDMGMIGGGLLPLCFRYPCVVMPPGQFAEDPMRWLRAISRYGGTISGAPNFAYPLCARRATETERAALDLSTWACVVNGAEPISPNSIREFQAAFGPSGFAPTTMRPMFGLAEATLAVTFSDGALPPRFLRLDRRELGRGRAMPVGDNTPYADMVELVGCGNPGPDVDLVIVNPDTCVRLTEGQVGEAWCRSPGVAEGYFNAAAATAERFGGLLAGGDGPFLRTGDMGFLWGGEFYFVSRLKDLIIVRGVNYSPQDVEALACASHPALNDAACVAFTAPSDEEERLVVVCELRRATGHDLPKITDAIRRTIFSDLGLEVQAAILVKAGSIPKTPSGKLQRHACRAALLQDEISALYEWRAPAERPVARPFGGGLAPRTETEMVQRFQAALGREGQSTSQFLATHLTDLGFDSVRLLEFAQELRRELKVRVRTAELYELGVMQSICRRIWDDFAETRAASGLQDGRTETNAGPAGLDRLRGLREARVAARAREPSE